MSSLAVAKLSMVRVDERRKTTQRQWRRKLVEGTPVSVD
jgi:hypothetical protein